MTHIERRMTVSQEPESFANAPQAIDEIRANKSHSAADISPRSTLIGLLRQIDSGEIEPETLVVVWASKIVDSRRTSGWSASGHDLLAQVGLLQRSMLRMIAASED